MSDCDRDKVLTGVRSLMVAENLGDVHDALNIYLLPAVGVSRLEGNYLDGWTDADWEKVEADE